MAITIYSGVEGLDAPKIDFKDWRKSNEAEAEYERNLIEYAKQNSKCIDAGKMISFPVADGCANYVVLSYSKLIHVATGDAWHYQYISRLTAADIKKEIKQREALVKLFS